MVMFKYISEIISHFTAPQRILALLLLLLSIVVVSVGPSYIDAITLNQEEYVEEIKKQKKLNKLFGDEIDTLNAKLIRNQRECTDEILQRERELLDREQEIWDELERLKRVIRDKSNNSQVVVPIQTEPVSDTLIVEGDTIVRVTQSVSAPMIIDDTPEMMLEGIEDIQRHIENDIEKRKDNN